MSEDLQPHGGQELLPPPVDDDVVEAVVLELNALHRSTTLRFALGVGRIVVDHFYGGDFARWRDHGKNEASFRKLAAHTGLTLSSSQVCRCVQVTELCDRLGRHVFENVSTSHLEAVLPLPARHQERLIGLAERHDWTVKRLDEEVREILDAARAETGGAPRGRPPLQPFVKTLNQWDRLVRDAGSFAGLEKAGELAEEERERLRDVVAAVRARCDAVEAGLLRRAAPEGGK